MKRATLFSLVLLFYLAAVGLWATHRHDGLLRVISNSRPYQRPKPASRRPWKREGKKCAGRVVALYVLVGDGREVGETKATAWTGVRGPLAAARAWARSDESNEVGWKLL